MSDFILIRHGQAQSGAKNEKDYDRLSALGYQQAAWLGAYLKDHYPCDYVVSGDLTRQLETVKTCEFPSENTGDHKIDKGLNELDYFGLSRSLEAKFGIAHPTDVATFRHQIPQLFTHWQNGDLDTDLEGYDDFSARTRGVLNGFSGLGDAPIILVTSAGVIAHLCALALRLDNHAQARIYERVLHTSLTQIAIEDGDFHLLQFGATPHLDSADRRYAKTNI